MKLLQKLDLFKIGIVVILSIFLCLFNQYSKNGRYESDSDGHVIDTRTGNIFYTEFDGICDKPTIPYDLR